MTDDEQWVTSIVAGRVTRFDKTTAGRSRGTWLVDVEQPDGTLAKLVLRRDTGDGPLSGTELSLQRESRIYEALRGTPVPVPDLLGISSDGQALLVERIPGTEDLSGLTEVERKTLADSFVDAVVALHTVDVGGLDLPGFHRPMDGPDHARGDIGLWRGLFDEHVPTPAPLLRMALRWLDQHPPEGSVTTVLCHGDLGPGNFMQQEGVVTGLLDWEFAHLGDPMDDLAWLTVRTMQMPGLGDLESLLERYHERSGIAVDAGRVRYYQLLVVVRMAIACSIALARRGSGTMDASTYFALLPLLERQITTLLAEQLAVELAPTPPLLPASPTERSEMVETLSNDLGSVLMPELQTPAARSRAMGMGLLLMHLAAADRLAQPAADATMEELVVLLGERPTSVEAGLATLAENIELDASDPVELIRFFSRRADRRIELWPILAAVAGTPLPLVASS